MADKRLSVIIFLFFAAIFVVAARFFYWQILTGQGFASAASSQRTKSLEIEAPRGKIYTNDNFCLVNNRKAYLLYSYLPQLEKPVQEVADQLTEILLAQTLEKAREATTEAETVDEKETKEELNEDLTKALDQGSGQKWVILNKDLGEEEKEKISQLDLAGLGFEATETRDYPEGSMAAHLLGFVGYDEHNQSKGYFGLEGFYDDALRGTTGLLIEEKDLLGRPIPFGKRIRDKPVEGRGLSLYLDRVIQFVVEEELVKGIERYQAKAGSVIVMDPKTGGILAMASWPSYEPKKYAKTLSELFPNPNIAETFEPGSIFKPLIMASAIEEKAVDEKTICDSCSGPKKVGDHTIRTWNDEYHPNSTIYDIIKNSDNVGMVFTVQRLGLERTLEYLDKFGFGKKTGVDLQEESFAKLKDKWYPMDLASVSFGQGIAITPLQMISAFSALANRGIQMKPKMVKAFYDNSKIITIKPEAKKRVFSPETTELMTKILVNAVDQGEAKWAKPQGISIAGKTGTAQIPIKGYYDEEKTIASFIGFAPAEKPQFVMLVVLKEPQTSPWGSETAAPLWFKIAPRILFHLSSK